MTESMCRLRDDTFGMNRFAVAVLAGLLVLPLVACPTPDVPDVGGEGEGEGEGAGEDGLANIDDARVRAIATSFNVAMKQCPERVWPGHSWDDNVVVLRSIAEDRAWLWSSEATAEVEPATLPTELRDFTFFSVAVLDGQVALGIDLDITGDFGVLYDDFATHLAIHEGFHFLGGQDDFATDDTGGRDPELPLAFEPRFLRERTIDALNRRSAALEEAAYWHGRHADAFAADAASLRGLDVIEGTAQYVETVGVIIARLGCDATDEEIRSELDANRDLFIFDPGYDAGGESYVLGPLAGVELRATRGQGWEEQAKSAPMHELLLADGSVTPAAVDESAPEHAAARADAEAAVTAANDAANASIAPVLTAWDDVTNVRLALPTAALVGSFGYEGGFVLAERPDELHVLINTFAQFGVATGDATLDSVTVVEDFVACGTDVFAVAIDPALATRDGALASFSGAGVDVSGVTIEERTAIGATWWCVQ